VSERGETYAAVPVMTEGPSRMAGALRSMGLSGHPQLEHEAMADPYEFLRAWIRDNVRPTIYDDKPEAERLAHECRSAANKAGVGEREVIKAAGGNLESYMLAHLDSTVRPGAP
jgi:hypothetical protein